MTARSPAARIPRGRVLVTAAAALLLAAPKGDVAIDGAIDVRDVLVLQRALKGELSLSPTQESNADVGPVGIAGPAGDSETDTGDLVVLRRAVAGEDVDADGLPTDVELALGLSVFAQDSDGNGISDGLEDADHDGLTNADEITHGLDPLSSDSDGDGILDGFEFAPAPNPAVATNVSSASSFLYDPQVTGNTPIQNGATPSALDAARLVVLRGKAIDRVGTPLAGVTVQVLDHPELGQTQTRGDGMFDLAVNGGGVVTIEYRSSGSLTVQRQVKAPWQDYVVLADVVLVPLDTSYEDVDLAAGPPIQVARASASSDASGVRRPTLLFRQGTVATAALPGGGTQNLSQLRVRATEYTVGESGPQAMPAELPPTSAYTYAVEFTADEARALGATKLSFSHPSAPAPISQYPVSAYLENFLGLPVGTPVPNGHYDPALAAWLPEKSGVVLEIVGVTGGRADLDVSGDGVADDTTALGIDAEERATLVAPAMYAVGAELWWVPLAHFSDFNLGPTLPPSASPPPAPFPLSIDPPDRCPIPQSSTILCESQTLVESVPVSGTPFRLSYASDRTPGYTRAYTLSLPLRGTSPLAAAVRSVGLDVSVAGRKYSYSFTPAQVNANGEQTIQWDGKDAYGRLLQGRQPATAELRYAYDFSYQSAGTFGQSGNGTAVSAATARSRLSVRQPWQGFVGAWDARGVGLGGWTLDVHHSYDPFSRVLYTGDGDQRRAEELPDVIATVVGGGTQQVIPPAGLPATDFAFPGKPTSVAIAPEGSLYVSKTNISTSEIYRVSRSGALTLYAGKGTDDIEEGIPATAAKMGWPEDVAVGPDGSVYIADLGQHRVRKVTPDGLIWTVAGVKGVVDYAGPNNDQPEEGIPATEAHLQSPTGLALAADGSLYIADKGHRLIRKVDPSGIIRNVAGIPNTSGPIVDGAPALSTAIGHPERIALDAAGNLFVSSLPAHRVYRITPDGILHFFAGTGSTAGPLGDNGPALQATIPNPRGLAVGLDGSLYIASNDSTSATNHRLRRVTPTGLISTLAGTGPISSTGDGGPAGAAGMDSPVDAEVGPDGALYVVELNGGRVRRIASSLPGSAPGTLAVPSSDGRELYEFDPTGKHLQTRETLRNSVVYSFGYDAEDRLITVSDADANVTTIEHDAQGEPTAIVGPFGDRTELDTDAAGWLSEIQDPAGGAHRYVSQPSGLLTAYTDPNGASASYTYDADGALERDTDRAGGWKELARSDVPDVSEVTLTTRMGRATSFHTERLPMDGGELRRITDPAGLEIVQVRDAKEIRTLTDPTGAQTVLTPAPDFRFGLLSPIPGSLAMTTPGGRSFLRTMTRAGVVDEQNGLLTEQTDTLVQNGRTSSVEWDAGPGTVTTSTFAGRSQVDTLDARGRLASSQLGSLHPLAIAYDTRGRIETLSHGPGGAGDRVTAFTYHPTTGRLTSIADPAQRVTSFDLYDAAGRVEQMTLPGNRVVAFAYDANGNLTSLTPPGRPAHVFRYTALDQEREYEPPALLGILDPKTVYSYNLDRQLELVTRPDGQTVDLDYETSTGRLDTITIAEGVYDYSYFPNGTPAQAGQLSGIAAPGGEPLAFTWDGQLPLSSTWSGSVAGTVSRTFDNDFRVNAETVMGTPVVSFGYDGDSLLISAGALTIARSASHGLVTGTTLGSVSTSEVPSAFIEPSTLTATHSTAGTLYSLDVSDRDALGRIETKLETVQGTSTTSVYTYDAAGRLDTVTVNGALVKDYAYDPNGNRTQEREDLGGPPIAAYDAQDRLTSYQGTAYTYSENGDLETKTEAGQTTTYAYDALGNLRSVEFPDGKRLEYVIDGQNRRVGQKVCAAPCLSPAVAVLEQGFLYSDQLRIAAELDASNQVVSRFVYGTRPNVPDFMIQGGTTYRILSDQVGSVRLVVNASTGAMAQRIDYDEFGNVTQDTSPGFQPFGFAGGLADRDTGLVRFGARDYEPPLGRWATRDPILFEGGLANHYSYVSGDPVRRVDPTGLRWIYQQSGGEVLHQPESGGPPAPVARGYSGAPDGRNDPGLQSEPFVGPIPQGLWEIGAPYDSLKRGPFVLPLTPKPGTETYGRSDFRIHGDNKCRCGTASQGCIILGPDARRRIWESGDGTLEVTP